MNEKYYWMNDSDKLMNETTQERLKTTNDKLMNKTTQDRLINETTNQEWM